MLKKVDEYVAELRKLATHCVLVVIRRKRLGMVSICIRTVNRCAHFIP